MAYTYLCVCLVKTSVSSFCLKFGCFITKGTMCSWQVWNFLREEVLLVTSFTNGVNLWHLLLCWYPKCIFLPINYTCFGRGLFCQRISWKKKLLIHNNINYYCEHFVCNLGSAAYVFEKKESEHEATVKFAYQELCEQVFLSNLTIFVSLLNKGFKKPLPCRIVASCLM